MEDYPGHALTPSAALGTTAFKAFLKSILANKMYYGPVLGWAWVRGSAFREVKEDGFDVYLVPDFQPGEYEKVGQEGPPQREGVQTARAA